MIINSSVIFAYFVSDGIPKYIPGKYVACFRTSANANVRQLSDSDLVNRRFKFSENLFKMLGFLFEHASNSWSTGIVSKNNYHNKVKN